MSLSYSEVADILKIIDSSQCEELVLEMENIRLVVRRGAGHAMQPTAPRSTQSASASQAAPAAELPADAPVSLPETQGSGAGAQGGLIEIRAPMVGTFYRRASPGDPPFVEEGSAVKPGDALALIEVMKLYTTIEATAPGTVTSILAEDGTLVEFNQLLFTIKPA